MPYVPKISENPEICPKHQMSQTPFVPKAKCPNYLLSQCPLFPRILVPIALCFIVHCLNSHFNQSWHCYSSHSEICPFSLLSQWQDHPRRIVPKPFCPQVNCPNDILSQYLLSQCICVPKKSELSQMPKVPTTFCPKSQMSQLHFVPISFGLLEISSNTSNSHPIFDQQGNSASFDAGHSVPKWIVPMTFAQ